MVISENAKQVLAAMVELQEAGLIASWAECMVEHGSYDGDHGNGCPGGCDI